MRQAKLKELEGFINAFKKEPVVALDLQNYFLGIKTCACKMTPIIARLQNYYNQHKNEII